MAEPADSALVTAALLVRDNRTAVAGKTATGFRAAFMPTLPIGKVFTAKTTAGAAAAGTVVTGTSTTSSNLGSADVATVTVAIDFATTVVTSGGVTSKYVRRQFFKSTIGDPSSGKWCYVSSTGQPLTAAGVATTVALAADANAVAMTAVGAAVPNGAQPGPQPGTYQVSELQQGYSRFIGWTAQKG
jgi:hypothetical protein